MTKKQIPDTLATLLEDRRFFERLDGIITDSFDRMLAPLFAEFPGFRRRWQKRRRKKNLGAPLAAYTTRAPAAEPASTSGRGLDAGVSAAGAASAAPSTPGPRLV